MPAQTENRDEEQQKRLEKLHWQLVESGGIGGWNTHEDKKGPRGEKKNKKKIKKNVKPCGGTGRKTTQRTKKKKRN